MPATMMHCILFGHDRNFCRGRRRRRRRTGSRCALVARLLRPFSTDFERQGDYYASARTNVVLIWALTNVSLGGSARAWDTELMSMTVRMQGILAAAILQGNNTSESFTSGTSKQSICERTLYKARSVNLIADSYHYADMLIILIMVAVLAVFRFVASTAYLLVRLVRVAISRVLQHTVLILPFKFAG
jgi:hypothetical protein